jgi:carbon storage regulator
MTLQAYDRPTEKAAVTRELKKPGNLVLSRKAGETITIGGTVEVTVIRVRGGDVRLGIQAPQDVSIVRGELLPWPGKLAVEDEEPTVLEEEDGKLQIANCKLQSDEHAA